MTAKERALSNSLAFDQPKEALRIAEAIEAPWFRSQALSHVGRYWPDEQYERILIAAAQAADSQDEVYKRVAASAWPIRAYLERGNVKPAQALLGKYTAATNQISNMGSRSEALLLLFQAAKPFSSELWRPVFQALVDASDPSLSWRQGRAVLYAAKMIVSDDRQLVQGAVQRLSNEKHFRRLKIALDNSQLKPQLPRQFFWEQSANDKVSI